METTERTYTSWVREDGVRVVREIPIHATSGTHSDEYVSPVEIAPMCGCGRAKLYLNYGVCDLCLHAPAARYRYVSPIGDTEPTGLQAAARLAGEQNAKVARLILAAVSAAGQMKISEDKLWERRDFDLIWESVKARDELLKAIQGLSQ